MKYPEYEATQLAQDAFFWYDFEGKDVYVPEKEDIEKLNQASPFLDKLTERAIALGYSDDPADPKALQTFLFHFLKEEPGIINSENSRTWKLNLKNWIVPQKGKTAPVMPGSREPVYQLCFALKMNASETGEFFLKGYLQRPYNFKNLKEVVYFYCLNNGLRYTDAIELFEKAQAMPFEKHSLADSDTATIGRAICDFHDDESFLDYIQQNRWAFETKSMAAANKIKDLLALCKIAAIKEAYANSHNEWQDAFAKFEIFKLKYAKDSRTDTEKSFDSMRPEEKTIESDETLLAIIYGYHARSTSNGKLDYDITLNKGSSFPKLIRENMVVNHQQLAAIQNGEAPAIARSALILFNFYLFFAEAQASGCADTIDLYDQFVDATNAALFECGYGQLYWRNPYDWMIGCCAHSPNPLDELRNLISTFYLDTFEDKDFGDDSQNEDD